MEKTTKSKLEIKNQLSYKINWYKFSYKMFFSLLSLGVLLAGWIQGIIDLSQIQNDVISKSTHLDYYNIDANTYTLNYFITFTVQSNLLCIAFFLLASMFPRKEGQWQVISQKIGLPVAIYITITGIIFNSMLLPVAVAKGEMNGAFPWFETQVMHTVLPIAFVVYIICFLENPKKLYLSIFIKKLFGFI